jgi:hypothetical protein
VQAVKELDFFSGKFFDLSGQDSKSVNYEENWDGVWSRA